MAWTLCTSGSAIDSAGANVNSTIVDYGISMKTLDKWSDEAESWICNLIRVDVVTDYSNLTANGKELFNLICSAHVAQKIIAYEPEALGISSATLRMNSLENQKRQAIALIKKDEVKAYIGAT